MAKPHLLGKPTPAGLPLALCSRQNPRTAGQTLSGAGQWPATPAALAAPAGREPHSHGGWVPGQAQATCSWDRWSQFYCVRTPSASSLLPAPWESGGQWARPREAGVWAEARWWRSPQPSLETRMATDRTLLSGASPRGSLDLARSGAWGGHSSKTDSCYGWGPGGCTWTEDARRAGWFFLFDFFFFVFF